MVPQVVFVCEHGAAKSVVAAAWLIRLAAARGIELSAVARGTQPTAGLSPTAVAGLTADGLPIEGHIPVEVSRDELQQARQVISFGPDLTPLLPANTPYEIWNVPPVSDGYDNARQQIVDRLSGLIHGIGESPRE
jgi:arsenate reductase